MDFHGQNTGNCCRMAEGSEQSEKFAQFRYVSRVWRPNNYRSFRTFD